MVRRIRPRLIVPVTLDVTTIMDAAAPYIEMGARFADRLHRFMGAFQLVLEANTTKEDNICFASVRFTPEQFRRLLPARDAVVWDALLARQPLDALWPHPLFDTQTQLEIVTARVLLCGARFVSKEVLSWSTRPRSARHPVPSTRQGMDWTMTEILVSVPMRLMGHHPNLCPPRNPAKLTCRGRRLGTRPVQRAEGIAKQRARLSIQLQTPQNAPTSTSLLPPPPPTTMSPGTASITDQPSDDSMPI
jgi:hypothetical protein